MENGEQRSALELLPKVFEFLLNPKKEVKDDTCTEKVCSWLEQVASVKENYKFLLQADTGVLDFLKSVSLLSATSQVSPSTLCFSFRLFGILASNAHLLQDEVARDSILEVKEARQLFSVSHDTWEEASVRFSWISIVTKLLPLPEWNPLLEQIDAWSKGLKILNDSSMFVAKAAQSFIAQSIILCAENPLIKMPFTGMEHSLNCSKDNLPCRPREVDQNQESGPERSEEQLMEGNAKRKVVEEDLMDNSTGDDVHKQLKISHTTLKRSYTNVPSKPNPNHLNQKRDQSFESEDNGGFSRFLLREFQICKELQLKNKTKLGFLSSGFSTEGRLVSILGVLEALVTRSPQVGFGVVMESSLILDCCHLIGSGSAALCDSIVDFLCLVLKGMKNLQLESKNILEVHIAVSLLPVSLLKLRYVQKAYKLVTSIITSSMGESQEDTEHKHLQEFILLPLTRMLKVEDEAMRASDECSGIIDQLIKEKKSQHLDLVCHSLVCLEKLHNEGSFHRVIDAEALCDLLANLLTSLNSERNQSHCYLGKMNKLLKVMLDLILGIFRQGTFQPSHTKEIVIQVLDVVSPASCESTVLKKGFEVLGLYLTTKQALYDEENADVLSRVEAVTQKHLMNIQWAARDNALNFIESLVSSSKGFNWIQQTKLLSCILDRLEDDESYVRASALSALATLAKRKHLWSKFVDTLHTNEMDIIRKVSKIILEDTEGFARRSAMAFMIQWTSSNREMKAEVISSSSLSVDSCATPEELVLCAVRAATRDLDWEVKLLALHFWERLLKDLLSLYNCCTSREDGVHLKSSSSVIVPELSDGAGTYFPDNKDDNDICSGKTFEKCDKGMKTLLNGSGDNIGPSNNTPSIKVDKSHPEVDSLNKYSTSSAQEVVHSKLKHSQEIKIDLAVIPDYASTLLGKGSTHLKVESEMNSSDVSSIDCVNSKFGNESLPERSIWDGVHILSDSPILELLLKTTKDEDRSVAQKACQMVLSLNSCLRTLIENKNHTKLGDGDEDVGQVKESKVFDLLKQIDSGQIEELLKGATEIPEETIRSLLQDMIVEDIGTGEMKVDVDCY